EVKEQDLLSTDGTGAAAAASEPFFADVEADPAGGVDRFFQEFNAIHGEFFPRRLLRLEAAATKDVPATKGCPQPFATLRALCAVRGYQLASPKSLAGRAL